jgi:hypothetical protein
MDDFDAPGQEALVPHGSVGSISPPPPPLPPPGVSRPASPSRAASTQALSPPLGLSVALENARLAKYESALRELGCELVVDLADLEEQDLMELGMKKIEVTRLRRLVT